MLRGLCSWILVCGFSPLQGHIFWKEAQCSKIAADQNRTWETLRDDKLYGSSYTSYQQNFFECIVYSDTIKHKPFLQSQYFAQTLGVQLIKQLIWWFPGFETQNASCAWDSTPTRPRATQQRAHPPVLTNTGGYTSSMRDNAKAVLVLGSALS